MSGRRIVLAIIVAILAIDTFVIVWSNVGSGTELTPQQVVRFVLTVGLCVFLYRGANWARWVTVVLFGLAGLAGLMGGIGLSYSYREVAARDGGGLLLIVMGLVYVASVIALLFVPTVRAYFDPITDPVGPGYEER